ncbi:Cof-type HAD-IIB family hydrolase [Staphylococcus muscae]|uniref:Cof family hydrolase n=1 Tax=Staphylococcus muscae TaxID=1294 RepID=A0A240C5Y4_9STAP|nr:HAD family hydrolase [Staphylococcus muscae]AVQ33559.1 Cof-type HAD-IIB family hydrolase [Staphylococcus muscae]PNZ01024.1 Cof-type HAD-IIB family hydrolase [Staphylococcus muscae]GGA91425.1 haloacid dehalogenase [Staphylococcus muscae]SNW03521.1 cof family hydrolase [Staphylococcus muscae]
MQQVKAIFLDMDGTILRENNRATDYTSEAISRLRQTGYKVFLATGRAKEEISLLIPDTLHFDGIISSNGTSGHIGEDVLFQHGLSDEGVRAIVRQAQDAGIYYEVFPFNQPRFALTEDKTWMLQLIEGEQPQSVGTSEWLSRQEAVETKLSWQETFPEDLSYSKIYLFHPDLEKIAAFREAIKSQIDMLKIEVSQSTPNNVETMAYQVNKGTGIQEMCQHFNIDISETLVMGDSDNDRTMFEVGGVTVAMKNASDAIKALTMYETSVTNNDDGAARFLIEHLMNK